MGKLIFKIDGMCCAEEIGAIKKALNPLLNNQEDRLAFDMISEKIIIEQEEELPLETEIINAVQTTGMKATPWKTHVERGQPAGTFWQKYEQPTLVALGALTLGAGFITHAIEKGISHALATDEQEKHAYPIEVIVLYAISMAVGGRYVLPKALRAIFKLRPDMHLLMTIAITGAAAINQWFEAATASTLFSTSLLLESWNLNRARNSIRTLVELTSPTARVIEKRNNEGLRNQQYVRHLVTSDEDCGYAVLGVTRYQALKQLIESIESIKNSLKPAIQAGLLRGDFYQYLIKNNIIAEAITHQELLENITNYDENTEIIKGYLNYDIRDKQIDAGWTHPSILQALANLQQKEIRMWQLNQEGLLMPHAGNDDDYRIYIPTTAQEQLDLLFIDGNHFEKIEFYDDKEKEEAFTETLNSTANQNIVVEKAVEEISIDSIIVVRPGEKIPMDSILISEPTEVNQAPITGESMPVRKEMGDELFAGTINGDAAILCKVTRLSSDSTLSRIINMVETAQSRRSNSEQFIDKFATYYTPFIMIVAIAMMIILPLVFGRSWKEAFYQALQVLVTACPCALVISTPISIVAGLNAAARSGVLIKGGMYLEAPAHIKAIALDKTGTLTSGEPTVQEIITLDEQSEEALLELALILEQHSDHPLARAIRRKAEAANIFTDKQIQDFRIFKGKGAEGYLDGTLFWIGSPRLLQEKIGNLLSIELQSKIQQLENSGHSVVAIGYGQQVCGLIGISDAVRAGSKKAIQALKKIGIENISMLTGDNEGAAKAIAQAVGIDDYQAELLPEDKVKHIESLVEKYQQVAMVGDGINDAPAMAASSLAIAMGAVGSDAAIETADIALMADDLEKLPWLINHSRRTLFIIKQNVVIALSIKAIFMALAFANKSNLAMAVLADMGSSFIVVFNALRLLDNRLSLDCNVKGRLTTCIPNYNSQHSLILEEEIKNLDKIEITVEGKNISFKEQSTPKKACCSKGDCSKPKEMLPALSSNQPTLPELEANSSNQAELKLVSSVNTFFKEQSAPKKACCSKGSCSKPRETLPISSSNQLALPEQHVNTSNQTETKPISNASTFFTEQPTPKKSCCSKGSCSKPKETLPASNSNPLTLPELKANNSNQIELTPVNNVSTFFKEQPTPKKSCCSKSSCSKSNEILPVSSSNQSALQDRDYYQL